MKLFGYSDVLGSRYYSVLIWYDYYGEHGGYYYYYYSEPTAGHCYSELLEDFEQPSRQARQTEEARRGVVAAL